MDLDSYLRRINYEGPVARTSETVRRLHYAHLLNIPFENLDIWLGREIVLDEGRLFEKIVLNRRGGFCYELNGLFAALLRELGFQVTLLSARVAGDGGRFSREFDHLTLLVQDPMASGVQWLADVGFGDGFEEPLRLADAMEQAQSNASYRLVIQGKRWVLQRRDELDWYPVYDFSLKGYQLADFSDMCRYHQTSPDSHFTHNRICSLATATGRITLSGMRLIETNDSRRVERTLQSDEEYQALLRDRLGIVIPTSDPR
jgi:N-hydroxyarylamine O-acetyltransferase